MAALAFKAIDYGADRIPDKFFETIPGGFFTPSDRKQTKSGRRPIREPRHKSQQGDKRRSSRRHRSPSADYSDYTDHDDSDFERDHRAQGRRARAKSLGHRLSRSLSRSLSRGRNKNRNTDVDGEYERYTPMDRPDRFDPPPNSDYRPYNPQDYAAPAAGGYENPYARRGSSAMPDSGYSPQPAGTRAPSSSAARYTPGAGYAPSPVNFDASVPPPPSATGGYAPYNPADYASPDPNASYRAPGNAYPSPPPFYRQESRSQPSITQYSYPTSQNQLIQYDPPPTQSFQDSDSQRHHRRDSKHHRAKSAGHHGRSRSRVTDQLRGRFENLDTREKDLAASVGGALAGGLAGGAIGKGNKLTALVGAAIGGLGARELERRHEKKHGSGDRSRNRDKSTDRRKSGRKDYSRSPSRDRRRDSRYEDDVSFSDSDSDRQRAARKRRESRRRRRDSDDF